MDKSKLRDTQGRPLTQSLFLEIGYNTKYAIFTLDDQDKLYKGKTYLSLKKLFLEQEDVTEYVFANRYLLGWSHWQRLNKNAMLKPHFEAWRFELELQIRSSAIQAIIDQSAGDKGFQAAKWLAVRGWDKRAPGRPSKDEVAKEAAIQESIEEEFLLDAERLSKLDGNVAKERLQ